MEREEGEEMGEEGGGGESRGEVASYPLMNGLSTRTEEKEKWKTAANIWFSPY